MCSSWLWLTSDDKSLVYVEETKARSFLFIHVLNIFYFIVILFMYTLVFFCLSGDEGEDTEKSQDSAAKEKKAQADGN